MIKEKIVSEDTLKDLKIKAGLHGDTPDEVISNCREAYNEFIYFYNTDIDCMGADLLKNVRLEYGEEFDTNEEYLQAWASGEGFVDDDHNVLKHVFGYWVKDRDYRKKYIKSLKKALNLKPDTPENVIDEVREKYRDENGYTGQYSNEEFLVWMSDCDYKEWCEKWSKYCGSWYTGK